MANDLFPPMGDDENVSSEATDQDPVAIAVNKTQAGTAPPIAIVPPLEDIIMPRRLKGSMYHERVQTIKDAPDPYNTIEIVMWVNPPSNVINAVAEKRPMLRDFLFEFVRGWNLEYEEDENGHCDPVEFNRDNMAILTEEYIGWLGEEFRKYRTNPLVKLSDSTSSEGKVEKRLSGGSTKSGRNGSG